MAPIDRGIESESTVGVKEITDPLHCRAIAGLLVAGAGERRLIVVAAPPVKIGIGGELQQGQRLRADEAGGNDVAGKGLMSGGIDHRDRLVLRGKDLGGLRKLDVWSPPSAAEDQRGNPERSFHRA